MKQFSRFRTLAELRAVVAERGWELNTRKHDEEGSDFVSFKFKIGRTSGTALFNVFNGRIIGELSTGKMFSSDRDEHEKERWFQELLNIAYESEVPA